jgi:membrane protein DedA with SNARE-associated domain
MGEQFAPIPGEPLLLAAGALAGTGHLTLGLAAAVALLGAVVGDIVWYEIGRRGGHRVLRWLCRVSIEPDSCVRRGEEVLSRRGAGALLVAKFVPGLHSVAQPLAGALGMRRGPFLVFDVLGALLWVGLYVGLGYAFHDQLVRAAAQAERLGGGAFLVLAGAFAVYAAVKIVRRQRFLRGLRIARITLDELKAKLDRNESVFVVDLRHRIDVQAEPTGIPGAVHMEPSELEQAAASIPRDRDVVVYCT